MHFSSTHANYYTAFKYVTKEDSEYEQSAGHPNLLNVAGPSTSKAHEAMQKRRTMAKKRSVGKEAIHCKPTTDNSVEKHANRRKRLSSYEVSQIILSNNLKDRTELMAHANMQKNEGKTDLAEFVINRGNKVINELIKNAWEMDEAQKTLRRREKSRIDLLHETAGEDCVCESVGLWELCALEILHSNCIPPQQFRESVKLLLEKGRGKYRNMMLTGPANCGKTFLLNPLNQIYHTFTNPASSNFAWVGAEKAEVIFLNDFRWSSQVIQWHDFLLMLEGQVTHLPAPKSYFASDVEFDRDTPIFCTTKQPLSFVRNGYVDERGDGDDESSLGSLFVKLPNPA